MPNNSKPTFDEYKSMKDEIVAVSVERFENILNKKLNEFRTDIEKKLDESMDNKLIPIYAKLKSHDEQFERIDRRFDDMEEKCNARFDAIDARFDAVDSRFEAVDAKFVAVDARFDSLERRLTVLTWLIPLIITLVMSVFKFL